MKNYPKMQAPPSSDSVKTVIPKVPQKATTVKSGRRSRKGGRSSGR